MAVQLQVAYSKDIIGAGVCAVPAAEPQGFRVQAAFVDDAEVMLSVLPGRAWADGILARLAGALYLVIIVFGLFGEMFVRGELIVWGDPTATAERLLASPLTSSLRRSQAAHLSRAQSPGVRAAWPHLREGSEIK